MTGMKNWQSLIRKRTIMYLEGMDSDEVSLGTVEDELYLGGEEKGVFLLQRT